MSLSLYVHIPFCLKRCIYCDFVSGIYDPDKAAEYIEALKKEISFITASSRFSTLYIGGGTPTALSTPALKDIIEHIFTTLDFSEGYEATVEVNPGTVDLEKLEAAKEAGMNRMSIGVQSFNDEELKLLGRLHTSAEAEKAFSLAREVGFENIGVDLIYGIPGQSLESWKETIEKTVSLRPEHISAYELTVEEGTELFQLIKKSIQSDVSLRGGRIRPTKQSVLDIVQKEIAASRKTGTRNDSRVLQGIELNLPDEEIIIEMYEHTIDYLVSKGYEHYEISNFAKPGCHSSHNLNYWERGEYYGAGLGAHSFINGKRENNTRDIHEYTGLLSCNNSPVVNSEIIPDDKAFAETVFLGLRKTEGIDLESLSALHKMDLLKSHKKEIEKLVNAGLIEVAGSNMRLTRHGLLLSNEVFVEFV
jgi:oxygen-independent coproporphyrinogen-3 oxidase